MYYVEIKVFFRCMCKYLRFSNKQSIWLITYREKREKQLYNNKKKHPRENDSFSAGFEIKTVLPRYENKNENTNGLLYRFVYIRVSGEKPLEKGSRPEGVTAGAKPPAGPAGAVKPTGGRL